MDVRPIVLEKEDSKKLKSLVKLRERPVTFKRINYSTLKCKTSNKVEDIAFSKKCQQMECGK